MIGTATVQVKTSPPRACERSSADTRYELIHRVRWGVTGVEIARARNMVRNSLPCDILRTGLLIPAFAPGLIEAARRCRACLRSRSGLIPAFAPGLIGARRQKWKWLPILTTLIPVFADLGGRPP